MTREAAVRYSLRHFSAEIQDIKTKAYIRTTRQHGMCLLELVVRPKHGHSGAGRTVRRGSGRTWEHAVSVLCGGFSPRTAPRVPLAS